MKSAKYFYVIQTLQNRKLKQIVTITQVTTEKWTHTDINNFISNVVWDGTNI